MTKKETTTDCTGRYLLHEVLDKQSSIIIEWSGILCILF